MKMRALLIVVVLIYLTRPSNLIVEDVASIHRLIVCDSGIDRRGDDIQAYGQNMDNVTKRDDEIQAYGRNVDNVTRRSAEVDIQAYGRNVDNVTK